MPIPFLPFDMTWGEAAMVAFVSYFALRDIAKAAFHTYSMSQWKSIIRKSNGNHTHG